MAPKCLWLFPTAPHFALSWWKRGAARESRARKWHVPVVTQRRAAVGTRLRGGLHVGQGGARAGSAGHRGREREPFNRLLVKIESCRSILFLYDMYSLSRTENSRAPLSDRAMISVASDSITSGLSEYLSLYSRISLTGIAGSLPCIDRFFRILR